MTDAKDDQEEQENLSYLEVCNKLEERNGE